MGGMVRKDGNELGFMCEKGEKDEKRELLNGFNHELFLNECILNMHVRIKSITFRRWKFRNCNTF